MTVISEPGSFTGQASSKPHQYWAFISYAHHDARIAQTLKKRLAEMRVPPALRSKVASGLPTFSDIFLDVHDAGADHSLNEELEEALAASRYLIVICSPISRNSIYVNEEIRYFQRMGRSEDILFFVGYGIPGAAATGQPHLECLPIALEENKHAQPLAAVIGGESEAEWRLAVEKTAAGLSGRSLKEYRQSISRHKARRLALVSLLTVFLAVAAYGTLWAYYLPNVSYATTFVRKNGLWLPVKPISSEHASHLNESYRFIAKGAFGPLQRVEMVNRFNRCEGPLKSITGDTFSPSCSNVRVCAAEFDYVGGEVKQEKLLDQYGNAVETLNYLRRGTGAINEAIIGCSFRPGNIAVVKFERFDSGPQNGFDKKLTFWAAGGVTPAPNANFAYGLAFEYDDAGEINRVTTLDATGLPTTSRQGFATKVRKVSPVEISEAYFDPLGKAVNADQGFHREVKSLDKYGATTSAAYFDKEDQPTNSIEGFHRARVDWRSGGKERLVHYFDIAGAPTRSKSWGAALSSTFDSRGNVIESRYFDSAGKLVSAGARHCAIQRWTFDASMRYETNSCFDQDGKPTYDRNGVHTNTRSHNKKGMVQEIRHFGPNNIPVFCNDNGKFTGCPVHRMVSEFDDAGNRIRVRFYAPDGTRSTNAEGLAGWNSTFTSTGLEARRTGIGIDGQPSPNKNGVVVHEYKYDSMSQRISERYLTIDGKPMLNDKGISGYISEYGKDGKANLEQNIGISGEAVRDETGISVYKHTYDEFGRVRTTRFFDVDAKTPLTDGQGWHGIGRDYDAYGNVIKSSRLGQTGEPQPAKGGMAGYVQQFDPLGRAINISTFGRYNELVANSAGISTTRYGYQTGDIASSIETFDLAGKPAKNQYGIARTLSEFDNRGRVSKASWHDVEGAPLGYPANPDVTALLRAYDERGRIVRESYIGKDGKPASNKDGIFGMRFIYDEKNRVAEQVQLNANGDPLDTPSDPARMLYKYDPFGRQVLSQQLRADGAPPLPGIPTVIRVEYDSYGRRIKRQLEDAHGLVLSRTSGRSIIRYEYDKFGRVVVERSFDTQDAPVNRKDLHWSTVSLSYDEFDQRSAKCATTTGATILPCTYDE